MGRNVHGGCNETYSQETACADPADGDGEHMLTAKKRQIVIHKIGPASSLASAGKLMEKKWGKRYVMARPTAGFLLRT